MEHQEKTARQTESAEERINDALVKLVRVKQFEHVTVTEICRQAHTSRITFYTHFADKYALLNKYFKSMTGAAAETFFRTQKINNIKNNPIQSWCNFLDAVLGLNNKYGDVLSRAESGEDPYLYFCFHREVLCSVKQFIKKNCGVLKPKYSVEQISSLLCDGMWGFIDESRAQHIPETEIRREAEDSLRIILNSRLFAE